MLKRWLKIVYSLYSRFFFCSRKMGYCGNNVFIDPSVNIVGIHNIYMYDNTKIFEGSTMLCSRAKFIMKKNSGAADGFTVVTGEHMSIVGRWFIDITDWDKDKDRLSTGKSYDHDIIVEEDVWIATNVTLLSGIVVGRGAIIGSGTVCRNNIPPYAIVIGNPAKVVSFRFSPKQIIEHEEILYPTEERLSLALLEENYKKYFLERIQEITKFVRL